ncbi:MAG: class I poly(R)-hydroxyalkanoic acid synthase [Gammaproteobacteria bacterium]|nr:MAG: class I poly(R)-hydroxyalkanoic acid synthase [Gammaproteobacteria bacterium]
MNDFNKLFEEQMNSATASINEMMARNTAMMTELFNQTHEMVTKNSDPLNVTPSFTKATEALLSDPQKLMQSNYDLWKEHMDLWQQTAMRLMSTAPAGEKEKIRDRRFRHEDWTTHPMFDFIRRSYQITARWMVDTMSSIDGLDEADRNKVIFHTRLLADAFAPSNFFLTNPEALRTMMETGGKSVIKGLRNLQRDLDPKTSQLNIRMTDPDAFKLGENIATTPGKVVYQNNLVQLIQYTPTTDKVYKRPLVIAPPWINKFYILDLQRKNSFIAWAVDQGYTVFVISWKNPDESFADKTFADYMKEGILESLDAAEKASGVNEFTMIGYCIGGTLLSATLAYMAATGDKRVKAATFFASQVDFSEAGDLKVFTDKEQIDNLERMMDEKGYLEGSSMATTFNMLRANDLIWSFYVDNYLLGKDPMQFDLLYWNSDSTRMPRNTHLYYLREMYLNNNLAKKNGITLDGVKIDLSKVEIPIYLQAAKEDHIAPYPSVFKSTALYGGPVHFMLAGSGHIAGVINPPAANKYQYWVNESQPKDLDAWLEGAEEHPGSWWGDWDRWLAPLSGSKVAARIPGDGKLDVIEDAPGSYVQEKS